MNSDSGAITYRDAEESDAGALAAFAAASFTHTFAHLYPPEDLRAYLAAKYQPEIQAREMREPDTRYRLALRDGAVVGYAMSGALSLPVDCAGSQGRELYRLYVDESCKGQGVAQALMDYEIACARADGVDAIYLSVWENNARAQRFYSRYGFEHVGEHKFMVGSVADRDLIWRLRL